jgi:hypothetical protein
MEIVSPGELSPAIGDQRVDRALARLDELDSTDVAAHAAIFDEIQRSLAAVLDDGPAVPLEQ